ncbi:hypothetical protein PAECIP111892_03111 [Paenibacillus auburnensis]|uniref:Alcohol acetyltransferase n=1 Tax=Paenibacillus auburnensis TaxID=2905649 RepID=A0ABM9CD78_9BACL|nr:hypothetical protein [Paenibacillus auburnensis]CAH1208446.1 hypothetical protein PAECIP111892_03111 [Paenibacillus auburnensis]
MNFKPNTKIKLDHLGQFYATINSENNPGTYSVSAHLKDPVVPVTLQQAVNDLMQRLPFMNVRSKRGFMWYFHELHENPPIIVNEKDFPALCSSFKMGTGHLMRIIYGDRSVTIEVLHTVCDGRSLAMVVSSLLARYFELLGEAIKKEGLIDCNETVCMEEAEDAYARYADLRKSKPEGSVKDVYVPKFQPTTIRIITHKIRLSEIKARAKSHGLTISEYILVHICSEFAKQRELEDCTSGITVNVPIDCRGFFPSKSLRNFVSHKTITMPESMNFSDMGQDIRRQFTGITQDYIQSKISEMERAMKIANFLPLFVKEQLIRKLGEEESAGYTTGFSNLGLIRLPKEILDKLDSFSFTLGAEPAMPYQFACVAVGDTLTFTTTTIAEDDTIIDRILEVL